MPEILSEGDEMRTWSAVRSVWLVAAVLVGAIALQTVAVSAAHAGTRKPGVAAQAHSRETEPVGIETMFSAPPLGWDSWNGFMNSINASVIEENARALVSSGLAAAGYRYVIIDEGWWQGQRDAQGNIVVDQRGRWGMGAMAHASTPSR